MRTFLILSLAVILTNGAILGEWDNPERDSYQPQSGRQCDDGEEGEPGVKWFVDQYREQVYPFFYLGCGGDGNVYPDVPTAEQNLPKDSSTCEGFNMTGWPEYGNSENEYKCPEGSKYVPYGEVSAICCDLVTAERYRSALLDKCPNGELPLTHEVTYINSDGDIEKQETRTVWGKRCAHNFCPEQYSCHSNEFLSFCCPSPPPTTEEISTTEEERELNGTLIEASELVGDGIFVSFYVVLIGVLAIASIIAVTVFVRGRRAHRTPIQKLSNTGESTALNP